ncbi:unnamed protein product [Adineta ricciae]|uniref:DUF7932 domain-containing protein n=1 Tax=Adineta ricciae TaxID=249248 RepID=A0A815UZ57_ADIRI|nr:unnamed protein product [Adineta ricciae]CAF1528141.1 unnamed protein product [Adineta ricciae]
MLAKNVISISGLSGSDGCSGKSGSKGISGRSSTQYDKAGGNGGRGAHGSNGQPGESGANSRHALIELDGSVDNLRVRVKKFETLHTFLKCSNTVNSNLDYFFEEEEYSFQLQKSKEIVLIKARGGNGGAGGRGGNGGSGGNGGHAGPGRNGRTAMDIHSEGVAAENGGDGRDGASGGRGGDGGNGGNGGNGGDAGDGGHVEIYSSNSHLFMLIEVDCQAGLAGKGGCSGTGGVGGVGGAGGAGGRGGRGGHNSAHSFGSYNGSNGAQGSTGTDGSDGKSGKDGLTGVDGCVANHGSVQYTRIDMNGNVIERGPTKYHASVSGYTITNENNDEIYEPNSDFFITDVRWTNNGSITLPSGSILSFSSTKYISNKVNDASLLMQATVNQTLIDSHKFRCHLNAVPVPSVNQPYIQPVIITAEIKLLNRLFRKNQFSTTITCQYPIQIINVQVPTVLGIGERDIVTITFKNISTRSYGTCPNSAGFVEFIFSCHPLIKIISINGEFLYDMKNAGNDHYKVNEIILRKSTKHISFEVSSSADAIYQVYESLPWSFVLLLRDKPIEKHENNIQIVPSFRSNIHTDVLLFTSSPFTRTDFLTYMNLFRLFNYSNQLWDIRRYGTFHHPTVNWLNTTDLIIFISSDPQSTYDVMKSELLLQHMNSSANAGFICMNASEYDQKYVYQSILNSYLANRIIIISGDNYSLVHRHLPFILSYGLTTKLQTSVDKMSIQSENQDMTENKIHLNSRFGRLICAILMYQGFGKSYRIISEKNRLADYIFVTDSIQLDFNQILVSLAMSIIEYEYDRNSLEFLLTKNLMKEIANIITNKNSVTNNWFYLLIQSLYEYIDSKFSKSFPWCTYTKKAQQRHKLQKIINDITSLAACKIPKNKEIYDLVRDLRLQRLAKLQLPGADHK